MKTLLWILMVLVLATSLIFACGDDDDDDDDSVAGDDDDAVGGDCNDQVDACVKPVSDQSVSCLSTCGQQFDTQTQACKALGCNMTCYEASYDGIADCILAADCEDEYKGGQNDPVAYHQCYADCAATHKSCYDALDGSDCADCDGPYQECLTGCQSQFG